MSHPLDADFPPLSDEVVDAIDRMFPLRNPHPTDSLDLIRHRAGQRTVVERLREIQAMRRRLASEDRPA
jgi:hypothetical protein